MFFRNLMMFRFPPALDLTGLEEALALLPLRPVGPLELSTVGFVPPMGRDAAALTYWCGAAAWIALGGEERLLPPAVVNEALARKLAKIELREGRRPGGRRRKRIREELVYDMLPRAFVRPRRTSAMLDTARGLLVVDTSSRRVGEAVASSLRHALGSFPALPLNAEVAPRTVLTGWLAGEALPDGVTLGAACELQDPADGGTVRIRDMELASDEIAHHLEAGKQVTRLALELDGRASFEIGEDLVVRKLRLLDGALETLDSTEHDDLHAELAARFALMAGEVGAVFDLLERAFRISKAEG
jgi:recombination associated protein RdgC